MAETDTKAKPEDQSSEQVTKDQKKDLDNKMKDVVGTTKPAKAGRRIKPSGSKKTTAKKGNTTKKADSKSKSATIDATTERVRVPVKRHFGMTMEEITPLIDIVYGRREPTKDELKRLRNLGDKIFRWARKLHDDPELLKMARLQNKAELAEAGK